MKLIIEVQAEEEKCGECELGLRFFTPEKRGPIDGCRLFNCVIFNGKRCQACLAAGQKGDGE